MDRFIDFKTLCSWELYWVVVLGGRKLTIGETFKFS